MLALLQAVCWNKPTLQKVDLLAFVALDWTEKTFHCISPDSLIVALRRFDSPDGFSQLYVQHKVVANLWREMLDTRRNRAKAFWHISGMSIVTFPVLNRDDRAPI